MNCPKCGTAISKPIRRCTGCAFNFGEELQDRFSFYFSWKEELKRLNELQNTLYAGIANVTAKIKRYEEIIERGLARKVGEPDTGDQSRSKKKTR